MLAAEHISFGFRRNHLILEDIHAEAAAGRITAMIGPNAVGKTTLLRILAGVLKPRKGVVRLGGRALEEFDGRGRSARVGYVAQRPVVDAPFTVMDVLELGRFSRRGRREGVELRFDWVVERCELEDVVERLFHELSVGQQQRVALARVLVQLNGGGEGKVLLLDEPMSAMDPQHIERTGQLLRELATGGTTVLMVLHDLGLAGLLADDVWALHNGRLLAAGAIGSTLDVEMLEGMYGNQFRLREVGSTVIAEPNYRFERDTVLRGDGGGNDG